MPRGLGCCYLDVAIYINDYMNTGLPQSYSGTSRRPSACDTLPGVEGAPARECALCAHARFLRFSPCPLPAAPYQLAQSMPILCWPPPVRRRFYIVAPRECQVSAIATTQHGKIVDQQTNKGTERVGSMAWEVEVLFTCEGDQLSEKPAPPTKLALGLGVGLLLRLMLRCPLEAIVDERLLSTAWISVVLSTSADKYASRPMPADRAVRLAARRERASSISRATGLVLLRNGLSPASAAAACARNSAKLLSVASAAALACLSSASTLVYPNRAL